MMGEFMILCHFGGKQQEREIQDRRQSRLLSLKSRTTPQITTQSSKTDFYSWNQVKVRYYDGSSFTDDEEEVDPMGINGRLQMHVQDLYTQKSSNTTQEASKISKLPHCSLFLSLLESFEKSFPTLIFPPLPERADFDLKDVLEAPYFFN